MAATNTYYCIFAIGPVQSFIAASRKLEDLWGGSYLLSFLIQQTLQALKSVEDNQQVQVDRIYPVVEEETEPSPVANYPNRITFTLTGMEEDVRQVMTALQDHVLKELKRIAEWAVKEVFDTKIEQAKARIQQLMKQAEEQVEQFLEVNWIAHPLAAGEQQSAARQEAERLFQALKAQRPVRNVTEKGLACTLYQRMDALCAEEPLPTDRYGQLKRKLVDTWSKRNEKYKPNNSSEPDKARIRDNEFLCAISLIRRVARDFFKNEYEVGEDVFARYETVLNLGSRDDGYYAVLLMDGDNMGQFFNGGQDMVRLTSAKLSHFAKKRVPAIVDEHNGVLLYAGGDDVLALFPVQSVLSAAYQLRMAFSHDTDGLPGATASAGIAIGHKRTPLQQMLTEARSLEKAAKNYTAADATEATKNAFALSVLPRSGEYMGAVVLPWTAGEAVMTEKLSELAHMLGKVVSTSFIYHFASTFQGLAEQRIEHLDEMVMLECYRLIDRAAYDQTTKESLELAVAQLPELYRQVELKQFIDLLKIMTFFSRKGEKT